MKPFMVIPARRRKRRSFGPLKWVGVLLLALVGYSAYFAVTASFQRYPLVPAKAERHSPRGAYHVHSTRSDGRSTPEEIARDARAAGLQFVVLSDHNLETLAPPRWVDGVLLIDGVELSTPAGHVVAVGLSQGLTPEERGGDVLKTVAARGGHTFLAHPEQKKQPWTDWARAPSATGLELYSADSMFRTAQRSPFTSFLPSAAAWVGHPVHGLLSVVKPQPEAEARLLGLAAKAPFVAICAHDAHGLPSYASEFQTLSMYLPRSSRGATLPADPVEAAKEVIAHLAQGRAWCAFHGIADGDGFSIDGIEPSGRTIRVGQVGKVRLPTATPARTQVRITGPATLLEDGVSFRIDGVGAVQVEVWAQVSGMYFEDGWKPWLVPSPLRAVPAPAGAAADPDAGVAETVP